jgi:hypothetical protein
MVPRIFSIFLPQLAVSRHFFLRQFCAYLQGVKADIPCMQPGQWQVCVIVYFAMNGTLAHELVQRNRQRPRHLQLQLLDKNAI